MYGWRLARKRARMQRVTNQNRKCCRMIWPLYHLCILLIFAVDRLSSLFLFLWKSGFHDGERATELPSFAPHFLSIYQAFRQQADRSRYRGCKGRQTCHQLEALTIPSGMKTSQGVWATLIKKLNVREKEMRWIDSTWLANGSLVGYSGNLEQFSMGILSWMMGATRDKAQAQSYWILQELVQKFRLCYISSGESKLPHSPFYSFERLVWEESGR